MAAEHIFEGEIFGYPGVRTQEAIAQTPEHRAIIEADHELSSLIEELLRRGTDPEDLACLLENYSANIGAIEVEPQDTSSTDLRKDT